MKNRYLAGLIGFLFLTITTSVAQETAPVKQQITDKPLLFSQLPDRFELLAGELQIILGAPKESPVGLTLISGKMLDGSIAEKINRSPTLTSINIKISNYPGALFTISIVTLEDLSKKIVGRIVHPQSGDALILVQEENRFYFEKKQQKFFMTE